MSLSLLAGETRLCPDKSPSVPVRPRPPLPSPRTGPLPLYLPRSIAVRTRGVFTHRDNFQKSACVERGLVRTAMFHALADVQRMGAATAPGQEPESRDAGVSRFGENGSHLAEVDAAEGLAGQVDGLGMSGNARIGSHLAGTDFSN